MNQWLVKLVEYAGYGTITVGFITFAAKFVIQPLWSNYLNFRFKKEELNQQSLLKREEMIEQSKINNQEKYLANKLEIEAVKLNRVLPLLEEISLDIANHKMMHLTYLHMIMNNARLRPGYEEQRLKIDEKIIESIYKISMYLPPEMRSVLNWIRNTISNSWKEPDNLYRIFHSFNVQPLEFTKRANEIYLDYIECFYDMSAYYCSVGKVSVDYCSIMEKHNISPDGSYLKDDLMTRAATVYLLRHEGVSTNQFLAIENEFDERQHKAMTSP